MMKKRWLIILCIGLVIFVGTVLFSNTERLGFKPAINAQAVVLMEIDTGRILVNHNGEMPLPPASMSNLMTELIILEDLKAERISWDDEVAISEEASTIGGVQLSLKEGDVLTVRELFQSVAVYSANDAAMALAEHASGSEKAFVQRMNAKAKEIGLSSHTRFSSSSAIDGRGSGKAGSGQDEGTRMTARDTALLAAHLIDHHPDVLTASSQTQLKIVGRDLYLSNTNWMLPSLRGPYSYEGTDGLKTGYNEQLGYCFTGTAERHGTRLIAVVMGTPTKEARFEETRKLFEYGFSKTLSWKERLGDWMTHPVAAEAVTHESFSRL